MGTSLNTPVESLAAFRGYFRLWKISLFHSCGDKSKDPCREFGCFQRLFSIVEDQFVSFMWGQV